MPRHRVRDIALQSGLSEATVDRVLNNRAHVRTSTADAVKVAIAELDRQQAQTRRHGRTFTIQVIVDGPPGHSRPLVDALGHELANLRPRVTRAPVHVVDPNDPNELVDLLNRLRKRRGAHGVVLNVQDAPNIAREAAKLMAAGIPVVTLNSELPRAASLGRAGLDEEAVGSTAAYLLHQAVAPDAQIGVMTPPEPTSNLVQRRAGSRPVFVNRSTSPTSATGAGRTSVLDDPYRHSGVFELVVDGVLIAVERIQGDDLDAAAERLATLLEPVVLAFPDRPGTRLSIRARVRPGHESDQPSRSARVAHDHARGRDARCAHQAEAGDAVEAGRVVSHAPSRA
jgi:hypothetical protein